MKAIWAIPVLVSILILGTFTAVYAVGVWEAKAPIPPARHSAMSANHDGLFYLMGGNDGVIGALSNFDVYDPALDTWTALAPLPEIRYATTAENIGDKIYVVGGWNFPITAVPHNTLYEYDIPSDTWTIKNPMPRRSGCSSSGSIDGILYVLNACDGFGLHKKFFDKYNPATDLWTALPQPPNYHADTSVGEVIDGKFYAVGGHDPFNNLVSALDVYDPTTNTWTTKAPIPTPRNFVSGGVIDGKLYVAGGWIAGVPQSTVEVYDPVTDTWETEASLLTARFAHAGEGISGKLYAVAGFDETFVIDTLEVFTPTPVVNNDADGDGFDENVDCNDLDATIFPGATETFNGIDDNCDGNIDEGITPEEATQTIVDDFLQGIIDNNPDTPLADTIQDTIDEAQDVLDELSETPPDNDDAVRNIGDAVDELQAAVDDGLLVDTQGTQIMDLFAGMARQIAVDSIDDAIAQGGDADDISEAQDLLAEGDALRASNGFEDAVDSYEDAVKKAEGALP